MSITRCHVLNEKLSCTEWMRYNVRMTHDLLTTAEAAQLMNCSVSNVRYHYDAKNIIAIRRGTVLLFRRHDIEMLSKWLSDDSGMTRNEIASKYNVSLSLVSLRMRRYEIHGKRGNSKTWSVDDVRDAFENRIDRRRNPADKYR